MAFEVIQILHGLLVVRARHHLHMDVWGLGGQVVQKGTDVRPAVVIRGLPVREDEDQELLLPQGGTLG